MGRIQKKKKRKTKGSKPKIPKMERGITFSTDLAKTEEQVVSNSGLYMRVTEENPDRIEISTLGDEKRKFMEIDNGEVTFNAIEPSDETMRWTGYDSEPTAPPMTNACGEVSISEQKYGKVDPDEVADRIRKLHMEVRSKGSAEALEGITEALESIADTVAPTTGDRFGHTYGDEEVEPAMDDYYDEDFEDDDDYFMRFGFAENEDRNGTATEQSIEFVSDLGEYIGQGDLTEMVAKATGTSMERLRGQPFSQAYISHTIRWARERLKGKIRGEQPASGRCQSIW